MIPKAARAAKLILAREQLTKLPVPVEQIAGKHAFIVMEDMADDISGVLIPLTDESLPHKWVIAVNSNHPAVRQRFTIAHELGHLILHNFTRPHADGRLQVRFRDEESSKGRVDEEIQANQFAAELLMPEQFVRQLLSNSDIADEQSDDSAVEQLKTWAAEFKVSAQALSLRIARLSSLSF